MGTLRVISVASILFIKKGACQDKSDTLYVLFEKNEMTEISERSTKLPDGYDYPQDWGRRYTFHKSPNDYVWFHYFNHPPEWADQKFEYKVIDSLYIESHNFKNSEWFMRTSYHNIIDTFVNEKIIYLVDIGREKNGDLFLIRVYFKFPVEE